MDSIGEDVGEKLAPLVESTKKPWEGPAMNMTHEYCRNQKVPQTAVVFYFHNKGASKWSPNWRDNVNKTWTYSRSLYWRKFLEYFLLERPHLCLDQILFQNATTCGANWHVKMKNHYSGNFWSASCSHVLQLKPMGSDENYVGPEFWLGRVKGNHSSFYSATKNLYNELILPEEYVFNFSAWSVHHHHHHHHYSRVVHEYTRRT